MGVPATPMQKSLPRVSRMYLTRSMACWKRGSEGAHSSWPLGGSEGIMSSVPRDGENRAHRLEEQECSGYQIYGQPEGHMRGRESEQQ